MVVDAHLGYYIEQSLGERVHEDVLIPYSQRGYQKFILVGISMGGVGALKISNDYPDLIEGTVLIAPFLGKKATYQSVGAFGNVHEWRQQLEDPPLLDEEIWTWIDTMYDVDSGLVACTILAYGRRDSFAAAGDVLAKMLPESHIFTGDGGHKWIVWQPLWSDITASPSWLRLGCAPQ